MTKEASFKGHITAHSL
jgi:hypothetical protein